MMNYFSIDTLIVYGFLLLTLLVGLWAGRKVKTIQDYAIANRAYGTGVLAITLLATYITASQAAGYVGYVYERGILHFISVFICGAVICFWFIGRYIAPQMYKFEGCLTLAEVMGRLYGKQARICVGVLGAFYSIVMVTLQIIWIGYMGEVIGIPKKVGILAGGLFLVIYCARGGMRAVTMTDILQFIAIAVFIPLVASYLFQKTGGLRDLFRHIPSNNLNFTEHPYFKDYIVHCIWGLFPAFPLSFPFIQRMLMSKNTRQIANSHYISILYLAIFYVLLTLVGFIAIYLKNMGDVNMPNQTSKVLLYMIKNYFPVGLKGVLCMGLIAAVMSTADSFLHSAGLLLAYDVIQPIQKQRKIEVDVLKWCQYATLLLGLISVYIAASQQDIPSVQYGGGIHWGKGINITRDFVAVVFTIPMIAGIMGLQTDARSFFVSMGATLIVFVVGKLLLPDLWFMPTVISVNAVSFFGAHYVRNQGFVTIKRTLKVLD